MSDQNKYKILKTKLTPEHWKQFNLLDDDIKDRVEANFDEYYYTIRRENCPDLFFLHHIFDWQNSPENYHFWSDIHDYYQEKLEKGTLCEEILSEKELIEIYKLHKFITLKNEYYVEKLKRMLNGNN